MEAWPTIFPNPTLGIGVDVTSAVRRTEMESGRVRQRPISTRQIFRYKATWQMTDYQWGMFQSWVKWKLHNGADAFLIDLPTGGEAYKTCEAQIVEGKYAGSNEGVLNWNVTATIEVQEAPIWEEADYDALLITGGILELEAAVENVEEFVAT